MCACACVRCAHSVKRGTCARVRACVVRRSREAWYVRVCVHALCAGREAWYVRARVRACVVRSAWSVVRASVRVCVRALCAGREAWYVCACACVRCAQGVDRGTCARVRAYVVRRA